MAPRRPARVTQPSWPRPGPAPRSRNPFLRLRSLFRLRGRLFCLLPRQVYPRLAEPPSPFTSRQRRPAHTSTLRTPKELEGGKVRTFWIRFSAILPRCRGPGRPGRGCLRRPAAGSAATKLHAGSRSLRLRARGTVGPSSPRAERPGAAEGKQRGCPDYAGYPPVASTTSQQGPGEASEEEGLVGFTETRGAPSRCHTLACSLFLHPGRLPRLSYNS